MRIHSASIPLRTGRPVEAQDVTAAVCEVVRASGVRQGLVHISVPHTTCAVCVNENEAGLRADLERLAQHILDPLAQKARFEHDRIDDNARAHLTSVLLGHQTTLPVHDGAPLLGTWQSIFLVESDGPRQRQLHVQVLGE